MKAETQLYNNWHETMQEESAMPKRKIHSKEDAEIFGERLARLRQAASYSQRDLAAEIGISNRMIAYYEKETEYPPAQ